MLSAVRTTLILASVLGALVVADVAVRVMDTPDLADLPNLEKLEIGEARRIRIVTPDETIVLERLGDTSSWNMTAPHEGPADKQAVHQLLLHMSRRVQMQVKLEEGNLKQYGLQPGAAIRVEFYENDDKPKIDFFIGASTVGGANFVRLPDDDSVYRAQIGGSHRYARPARDWRDPTVFAFEPGGVSGFDIDVKQVDLQTRKVSEELDYSLRFRKGQGEWLLDGDPTFNVDEVVLNDTLQKLGALRAGRVLATDFPVPEPWVLRTTVHRVGLDSEQLDFYVDGKLAYIRRKGHDQVFQISPSAARNLVLPPIAWQDRQLFNLDRAQIHRMTLHLQNDGNFVLQQDAGNSTWTVVEPANVDANLRESMQASIKLSQLRATAIAAGTPEELGFPTDNWIELAMLDGSTHRLELGGRNDNGKKPLIYVRTSNDPDRVGALPLRMILELRKAWSR
ncbi:MAG: hypothetical protein ACI9MC_004171 [Kiritimatiellia bacterium]|jgi:hypothetical protein